MGRLVEFSLGKVMLQAELTKNKIEEHTVYMRISIVIIRRFSTVADFFSLAKEPSAPPCVCPWQVQFHPAAKLGPYNL
jgi:hypothetical protein